MAILSPCEPLHTNATDVVVVSGSFQTNGGSAPSSTTFRSTTGSSFTVGYAATGVFTVTLGSDLTFPDKPIAVILTKGGAVLATDWFDLLQIGEYNTTTRALVIQAHRAGTANAPANTAGNRINFTLIFRNSTSK